MDSVFWNLELVTMIVYFLNRQTEPVLEPQGEGVHFSFAHSFLHLSFLIVVYFVPLPDVCDGLHDVSE